MSQHFRAATLVACFFCSGGAALLAAEAAAPALPALPATALHDEILRLDSEMFKAFNAHDSRALMAFFASDLEFYHDKGGLQTYAEVDAGFQRMFAQGNGIQRELVAGTFEVYPVPGFGAMETGSHRFCHVENGQNECGTFQFLQIWKQDGASWKVTRVMSYGH
ncbi:MAG: nuclear transport factor 2 family protein [Thermoanaerobaculia bacterium]